MIKKLSKISAVLLLGVAFTSAALASDAYYGAPKKRLTAVKGTFGTVVLHNYTNFVYDVSQTYFYPSGKPTPLTTLYQYGTGMDTITYDIDYPDTAVCITVTRSLDGYPVYKGCPQNGDVNIGPYTTANNTPVVKFVAK